MAIHGFDVTTEVDALVFNRAPAVFSTYKIQIIFEKAFFDEIKAAAAKTNASRTRWSVSEAEVAMRVADKLVQRWRKQGKIMLVSRGQWNKVERR